MAESAINDGFSHFSNLYRAKLYFGFVETRCPPTDFCERRIFHITHGFFSDIGKLIVETD